MKLTLHDIYVLLEDRRNSIEAQLYYLCTPGAYTSGTSKQAVKYIREHIAECIKLNKEYRILQNEETRTSK